MKIYCIKKLTTRTSGDSKYMRMEKKGSTESVRFQRFRLDLYSRIRGSTVSATRGRKRVVKLLNYLLLNKTSNSIF